MRTLAAKTDAQQLRDDLRVLFRDLNDVPWTPGGSTEPPAVDVLDLPGGVEIRIDLMEVGPDEMTVEVAADMLRIRGGRRVTAEETAGAGRYGTKRMRRFLRGIQLPKTLKPESLEAVLSHGLLTIRLDKRPRR